jgi:hypothetical protein
MTQPIAPSEARKTFINNIPGFVIESFNELIVENLNGRYATVLQKEAVTRIKKKMPDGERFNDRWLDIEDVYRANGWVVKYDKPGYNESYEPSFEFKDKEY